MLNRQNILRLFLLFSSILFIPFRSDAGNRVNVVTTIPTLRNFAEEVGKDRVSVKSLLKGGEDLHTYDPRPADARGVADADILIKIGLGLDGWVDRLVKSSGNKRLAVVVASGGVEVIHDREEVSSHRHGNPHVWHDIQVSRRMVMTICDALSAASPGDAPYFAANRDSYLSKLSDLEAELAGRMDRIRDRRVVTYHPGWSYLFRWLKVEEVSSIETVSGREPSVRDIARTVEMIKGKKIRVIIGEPEAPRRLMEMISRESGAGVVVLAPEIGSTPGVTDYAALMRYNVGKIAEGLGGK